MHVTYEYDNFIAVYEGSNINGHGVGGRTPGHRYYNSRGESDQPNGNRFPRHRSDDLCRAHRLGDFP
jgi:hypothetical protein